MKYTANELKNLTANATTVETYIYKFNNGNIHTDNITYLGNGCFDDSEIDELPYNENGEIDVDVQIMDSEDTTVPSTPTVASVSRTNTRKVTLWQ